MSLSNAPVYRRQLTIGALVYSPALPQSRGSLHGQKYSLYYGALAVAVAGVAALAQSAPLFHLTEKPGPHLVGLKVIGEAMRRQDTYCCG
jgi:hypothetical protein